MIKKDSTADDIFQTQQLCSDYLDFYGQTLCKKCRNTEFCLVRIQENTDKKKPRIWKLFTQ